MDVARTGYKRLQAAYVGQAVPACLPRAAFTPPPNPSSHFPPCTYKIPPSPPYIRPLTLKPSNPRSSSPRKIASARANGAKSRGPATAAGKQASARNALVHGLAARTLVLFNEPVDQYDAELTGYLDHFRPQTKPETDLVHQLAAAQWRIARYAAVESGLLEERMRDQEERFGEDLEGLPEHHRLAIAFDALVRDGGSLALLNRYQARLQNDYHRILKALMQMQAARAKQAQLPNERQQYS